MSCKYSALSLALALCIVAPMASADAGTGQANAAGGVASATQPTNAAQTRKEVVRVRSQSNRPVVGILLGENASNGVRIVGVTPQGAAAEAGVRSGDLLVAVDGKPVSGGSATGRVSQARSLLGNLDVEKKVLLGLSRDGKPLSLGVMPRVAPTVTMVDNLDMLPEDVREIVLRATSDATADAIADAKSAVNSEDIRKIVLRATTEGTSRIVIPQDLETRIEVIRRGDTPCAGDDCRKSLWSEALRWNNLSLIALEPQLGRYFGTDHGVLVLAQGALPGLQAGDVIHKIEGKAVATPREAMQAMTAKEPGQQARVSVLRDRAAREVEVIVPSRLAAPLEFVPAPPAPPAPPTPAVKPPAAPATPATAAASL